MKTHRILFAASLVFCLLAATTASASDTATASQPAQGKLTRVEAKKVCMVNNAVFSKDQIPVEFDHKTYYGCCEMCKERLAKDAASRSAVDPVTGKPVDKAMAVIGALEDGTVFYFESQKTFDEYAAALSGGKGGQ